jgi:hypothetical protein
MTWNNAKEPKKFMVKRWPVVQFRAQKHSPTPEKIPFSVMFCSEIFLTA